MEEEKLLPILVFLFSVFCNAVLADNLENSPSDKLETTSFINEITKKTNNIINKDVFRDKNIGNVSFYIFISRSIGASVIKSLVEQSKDYNVVFVFRGLIENSFVKTAEFFKSLDIEGKEIAFIIDPVLFQEFKIKEVPTYVLAKETNCPPQVTCIKKYDQLSGNVTPRFALKEISKKGELSEEATFLLEGRNAK